MPYGYPYGFPLSNTILFYYILQAALSSYYNGNGYVPTAMPYGYPYGFPMSNSGSTSVPSNNQTYVLDLPPATLSSGKIIVLRIFSEEILENQEPAR